MELSKLGEVLKKKVDDMTPLEMWAAFLRFAPDPKHRKMINELINRKEGLAVAAEVLTTISTNDDERARLRSRKKYEMDMYSNIHTAEERGRISGMKEGMQQGLQQGAEGALTQVIRNMKEMGMSIEDIAKATSLTVSEASEYYKL